MSKYQLLCSCINCKILTTTQSLKAHVNRCNALPKYVCMQCAAKTNNEKFCSNSCKATYHNNLRSKKIKPNKAQERRSREIQRFNDGLVTERSSLRKHLSRANGYKCMSCGVDRWNNKPITLIVDHIDGNAGNNLPENLQLLCPNCNSQTPTFGGRNKGNGRKARGLPLS